LEELDFSAKKKELAKMGEKRARMLSGLAYAKYQQLAQSKAARLGVELIFIDPAYTSVMGSVKYAVRLGRTVHQAAAGVIARRAQGYSEKLPQSSKEGLTFLAPLMGHAAVLTLPARNRVESTRGVWAHIRRSLTQHCAEQARLRRERRKSQPKKSSSHLGKGLDPFNMSVNSCQLDGRPNESSHPSREPGELLARHSFQPEFPDVPF
jgi:transposase